MFTWCRRGATIYRNVLKIWLTWPELEVCTCMRVCVSPDSDLRTGSALSKVTPQHLWDQLSKIHLFLDRWGRNLWCGSGRDRHWEVRRCFIPTKPEIIRNSERALRAQWKAAHWVKLRNSTWAQQTRKVNAQIHRAESVTGVRPLSVLMRRGCAAQWRSWAQQINTGAERVSA